MRLDKYLKVSHLVKRRGIAHDFISLGNVKVNDKVAKPSTIIKENDTITLKISDIRTVIIKVLQIKEHSSIQDSKEMYEVLSDTKNTKLL